MDAYIEWCHRVRHDCYFRLLRGRHRRGHGLNHRFRLYPGVPEFDGLGARSNGNDGGNHDNAVLCHDQQCSHHFPTDLLIRS